MFHVDNVDAISSHYSFRRDAVSGLPLTRNVTYVKMSRGDYLLSPVLCRTVPCLVMITVVAGPFDDDCWTLWTSGLTRSGCAWWARGLI